MAHRIVILGGGTGGTLIANRLHRKYGDGAEITVVDKDDQHVYQPGLLFVPFGLTSAAEITRPRSAQLHDGIEFRIAEVEEIDADHNHVRLGSGLQLEYDVLVIATGSSLQPEETEGLTGPGWGQNTFTFYTSEGATALHEALERFDGGRLVVNMIDLPIKCPVAPLEFCFLADWYLRQRGIRDRSELTFVTPLDAAFTKAIAAEHLAGLLAEKQITLQTEFATGQVDTEAGRLTSWDERTIDYDLLVSIPLHGGAKFLVDSPLADELGFAETNRETLQSTVAPNVFAIGDATNVPASKAGSVTHFEGETLVRNIAHHLAGEPLEPTFDGHTNCFIETGFHKALLIDFSYDVEPLPGRYPEPHVGPLPLLSESRLNHMAKLAFQWFYWHVLLPGRDLPGLGSEFQLAGKTTTKEQP